MWASGRMENIVVRVLSHGKKSQGGDKTIFFGCCHFLSPYYVPGVILRAFYLSVHFICMKLHELGALSILFCR